VYRAAGLAGSDGGAGAPTATGSQPAAAASSSGAVTCSVCMCDAPAGECSTNSCGHAFCDDCWRGHLSVQIGEGKARHVVCMSFKCGVVCDEALVTKVMKVGGGRGMGRGG
jgi:ariadne-1